MTERCTAELHTADGVVRCQKLRDHAHDPDPKSHRYGGIKWEVS